MAKRLRKQKRWRRLPGALLVLAATALLLHAGGPAGVAADSPAQGGQEPAALALADQPEIPEAVPPAPPEEPEEVPPEPEKVPFAPVPESAPVADTYFDDVVFLGDSRTEGFSLYSGLDNGTALFAVGATVESVFTKNVWDTPSGKVPLLDALAELECGKVYVMLGVNELGWSKTETFHDQYAKVIDRIRADHPEAEVVLQSLLPVSARQEAKGTYVNNTRIAAYNQVVRQLAEEKDCAFLDVTEAVSDETGCLRADWNFDGVHLNAKGCKAWLDYLRTHPVGGTAQEPEASETTDLS